MSDALQEPKTAGAMLTRHGVEILRHKHGTPAAFADASARLVRLILAKLAVDDHHFYRMTIQITEEAE